MLLLCQRLFQALSQVRNLRLQLVSVVTGLLINHAHVLLELLDQQLHLAVVLTAALLKLVLGQLEQRAVAIFVVLVPFGLCCDRLLCLIRKLGF